MIIAGHSSAIVAAIDAARDGLRVLIVIGSPHVALMRDLRAGLRAAGPDLRQQVTVLTNAEVVCVDSVDHVEAVLIRRLPNGRLIGVNASAIRAFTAPSLARMNDD